MDLLALTYFQVVARHEHISRAAAELRVAQPSVSRAIARLERELGVALFDRRGRRVRLNGFGRTLLRRVDRALAELDDGRRELAEAAGEQGSVTVAAETLRPLASLVRAFLARYPSANLRLVETTRDEMTRQLLDGTADLGFASQPLADPQLRSTEIVREQVLLAVPPGHSLAGRDRVPLDELADEPFITTRPGHWLRELTDRLFRAAGRTPAIVCEGNEPTVMMELVEADFGVALAPAVARQETSPSEIAWSTVDAADCHRALRLVWRTDGYLSTAAHRLRDFATGHFRP